MGVDLKWPLYKLEGWPWPQVVNIIVESDSTAIEPLKNIIFKILSLFLNFFGMAAILNVIFRHKAVNTKTSKAIEFYIIFRSWQYNGRTIEKQNTYIYPFSL